MVNKRRMSRKVVRATWRVWIMWKMTRKMCVGHIKESERRGGPRVLKDDGLRECVFMV